MSYRLLLTACLLTSCGLTRQSAPVRVNEILACPVQPIALMCRDIDDLQTLSELRIEYQVCSEIVEAWQKEWEACQDLVD